MQILNPTIIMAAGRGSRMRASSNASDAAIQEARNRPKAMIRVGPNPKPLLEHLLLHLREEGSNSVCIVISDEDEVTQSHFAEQPVPGVNVSFVQQRIPPGRTKPLGTAQAVELGLLENPQWKGHSVTVANGDNLPPMGLFKRMFEYAACLPAMDRNHLGLPEERVCAFAVIDAKEDFALANIIEKPTPQQVEASRWTDGTIRVSMNMFRVPYSELLTCVQRATEHPVRKERELPTAISDWAKKEGHLRVVPLAGEFLDLTHPTDIAKAEKAMRKGGMTLQN